MIYFHVWFTTKYKRRCLLGGIDDTVHVLINQISRDNNISLLAHETMLDHVHLLIATNSEKEIPLFIKLIKGTSARRVFQEFPMLKHQIKSNHLWAKGYAYKNIPKTALNNVISYINNQKSCLDIHDSPHFNVGSYIPLEHLDTHDSPHFNVGSYIPLECLDVGAFIPFMAGAASFDHDV